MCSLRACYMWLTRNHVFIREIWGKFTPFIFWNFEVSLISLWRFQNFEKVNSVDLSQISLLNMWLLVRIWFLLSVVNIFSKYAWVVPLKDKNGTTILNAFRTILNQSKSMAEISKNVYSGKVVEIINTAMHIIKPLKWIIVWKIMIKILNLKLVVVWEIDTPNWSAENFIIKKVKNAVPWTYVISDLKGEEIIGTFFFYVNKSKII